ncbi:DUF6153 family protein [Streptomyces sp. NPDC090106]|uniref:DUF6153 family protein n=1 Tax=Streptomyces sp. NPDC090106 TaxID=3365946 RepID=UPI0037F23A66
MNRPEQHPARPPRRPWWALLVLVVLAGLLGMHGLAPGGAMPDGALPGEHGRAAPMAVAVSPASASPVAVSVVSAPVSVPVVSVSVSVPVAHDGCGGAEGHCGGSGHAAHADSTCASGAPAGAPSLPVPVLDPVAVAVPEEAALLCAAAGTEGARAPPSLAELQLLRI